MEDTDKLNPLINAYKDLKSSKMVLAEKHISKLLKAVAETDVVYNLIAEKILGYDFVSAMTGLIDGEVNIEDVIEGDKVIPFVFCVLNEIDNKNIQTVAFIKRIFKRDSEDAFKEFCEKLVGAFVARIRNYIDVNSNTNEDFLDPAYFIETLFTKELIKRVQYIVNEISSKVHEFKKAPDELKKDIDIICYSIDLCVENNEFIGLFGLLSGLKQCIYPLKKFKDEIREIDLILESMNEK